MKHKAKGASSGASSSSPTKGKGVAATRGAGKGKLKTSSLSSSSSGATLDLRDLPLSLPDISTSDHAQWVPRYHAVLRRSEQDGVTMEDLDTLQLEMEAMLAATVSKKNSLTDEAKILDNMDKHIKSGGKGTSTSLGKRGGPSSPGKRGSSVSGGASSREGRDGTKRSRMSGANNGAGVGGLGAGNGGAGETSGKIIGMPKIKSAEMQVPKFDPLQNEQIRPIQDSPSPALSSSRPSVPKNETPNRFWAFVEPYCAPITPEDIKLLEDLIRSHGDMTEYYRIPPLGQHYTQRWAKEDMENERAKSAANEDADIKAEIKTESNDSSSKLPSKKSDSESETIPFGPMTQRLMQGLIEENAMMPLEDSMDAKAKGSGEQHGEQENKNSLIRSLGVTNANNLEARVRKELEEQGILSPGEDNSSDPDEIMEELCRCQNELRAVSNHNLTQLKRVLQSAKEELVRQELRQRLVKADAEVMDAYQKVSAARSKKRPPTKREKEQAWKALKEREIVLKELEASQQL